MHHQNAFGGRSPPRRCLSDSPKPDSPKLGFRLGLGLAFRRIGFRRNGFRRIGTEPPRPLAKFTGLPNAELDLGNKSGWKRRNKEGKKREKGKGENREVQGKEKVKKG